uniref:Uncharacterized protein n=1 Tax=Arundo donax TaxID=35708 RepID=A0A0A9AGY4_ARUDO
MDVSDAHIFDRARSPASVGSTSLSSEHRKPLLRITRNAMVDWAPYTLQTCIFRACTDTSNRAQVFVFSMVFFPLGQVDSLSL